MANRVFRRQRARRVVSLPLAEALIALAALAGATNAHALAFGPVRVLSAPEQPLRAEVELLDVREAPVSARALPTSEERDRLFGKTLPYDIKTEIVRLADGRYVLRLTSSQPIQQSALKFALQVDDGEGVLARDFSVHLAAAAKPTPAPTQAMQVVPARPATAAPATVAPAVPAPPVAVGKPAPAPSAAPAAAAPAAPMAPVQVTRPQPVPETQAAAPKEAKASISKAAEQPRARAPAGAAAAGEYPLVMPGGGAVRNEAALARRSAGAPARKDDVASLQVPPRLDLGAEPVMPAASQASPRTRAAQEEAEFRALLRGEPVKPPRRAENASRANAEAAAPSSVTHAKTEPEATETRAPAPPAATRSARRTGVTSDRAVRVEGASPEHAIKPPAHTQHAAPAVAPPPRRPAKPHHAAPVLEAPEAPRKPRPAPPARELVPPAGKTADAPSATRHEAAPAASVADKPTASAALPVAPAQKEQPGAGGAGAASAAIAAATQAASAAPAASAASAVTPAPAASAAVPVADAASAPAAVASEAVAAASQTEAASAPASVASEPASAIAPVEPAAPQAAGGSDAGGSDGGLPWYWVVLGAVALVVGAFLALRRRRQRSSAYPDLASLQSLQAGDGSLKARSMVRPTPQAPEPVAAYGQEGMEVVEQELPLDVGTAPAAPSTFAGAEMAGLHSDSTPFAPEAQHVVADNGPASAEELAEASGYVPDYEGLSSRLADAFALLEQGRDDEAGASARDILAACDALEAELTGLNKKIQG